MAVGEPKQLYKLSQASTLQLARGDITRFKGDAIVNAANERMLGGGGVDGAIHRAAGRDLYEACGEVEEVEPGVRCPTGEARITPGFYLPARYVVHTVGPIYEDAETSAPLLEAAHRNSMKTANQHGLKSIAFPAISCGVFGYPLDDAAAIALQTVRDEAGAIEQVVFFLHDPKAWTAFSRAAAVMFDPVEDTETDGATADANAKEPFTAPVAAAENGSDEKGPAADGAAQASDVAPSKADEAADDTHHKNAGSIENA